MNYWSRHIGDIIRDTVSLTMLEDGAYNRLLDQYYQTELPLPLDRKMIYRLARATSAAERKACDFVIETFFSQGADGYHQKRCDSEIASYQDKQRKAKLAANKRWSNPDGNANASSLHDELNMRTHCEGNAHQTPSTSSHTPDLKPGSHGGGMGTPIAPAENAPLPPPAVAIALIGWERERNKAARGITAGNQQVIDLAAMHVSAAELRRAYDAAVADRCANDDPNPVNAGFIRTFVEKHRRPRRTRDGPQQHSWHDDRKDTVDALTGRKNAYCPPPTTAGVIDVNVPRLE